MKQTIEIEVPDGKKAVWKDNKIVFEDIKPPLPKTWVEFCEMKKPNESEAYINNRSECVELGNSSEKRLYYVDRNVLPSKKAAKAHLALMQLHQLRDCYRQDWKPDWGKDSYKYCIVNHRFKYEILPFVDAVKFLSFQSDEIAKEFLNNFRDLIEEARDLI